MIGIRLRLILNLLLIRIRIRKRIRARVEGAQQFRSVPCASVQVRLDAAPPDPADKLSVKRTTRENTRTSDDEQLIRIGSQTDARTV